MYIGSTVRTLRTRVCEDTLRCFKTGSLLCHPPLSAVGVQKVRIILFGATAVELRILESSLFLKLYRHFMKYGVHFLFILLVGRLVLVVHNLCSLFLVIFYFDWNDSLYRDCNDSFYRDCNDSFYRDCIDTIYHDFSESFSTVKNIINIQFN